MFADGKPVKGGGLDRHDRAALAHRKVFGLRQRRTVDIHAEKVIKGEILFAGELDGKDQILAAPLLHGVGFILRRAGHGNEGVIVRRPLGVERQILREGETEIAGLRQLRVREPALEGEALSGRVDGPGGLFTLEPVLRRNGRAAVRLKAYGQLADRRNDGRERKVRVFRVSDEAHADRVFSRLARRGDGVRPGLPAVEAVLHGIALRRGARRGQQRLRRSVGDQRRGGRGGLLRRTELLFRRSRRFSDRQRARSISHRIVALFGLARRRDRVVPKGLARGAGESVGHRVRADKAGHCRRKGGIVLPVALGLAVGRNGHGPAANRQRARSVGHRIVALNGLAAGRDRMAAYVLARGAGEGVGHRVRADKAGHCRREGGIVLPEGLGLVVGRDGHGPAADRQRARSISHRIVALNGLAAGRDRIAAGVLARGAGESIIHRVRADKAGHCRRQRRIGVAVYLGQIISPHGNSFGCDLHGCRRAGG